MTVFDAVKNHEITLWYPLSIAKIVGPTGYLLWQGKIEGPQKIMEKTSGEQSRRRVLQSPQLPLQNDASGHP